MPNALLNKSIQSVKISPDRQALLFIDTNGGEYVVPVDADCCSHTWIESVELPALGFPFDIIKFDDLDLPGSDDNHPEHDCLQVYGVKLTTSKGDMVIDFRNSSNGYYGGSICWPDDDPDRSRFFPSAENYGRWEEIEE